MNIYKNLKTNWELVKDEMSKFQGLINKELDGLPYGFINGSFLGFDVHGAKFRYFTSWKEEVYTWIPYECLDAGNDEYVIEYAKELRKKIEAKEEEKKRIAHVVRKGKEAAKELKEKTQYLELKNKYGDVL